MSGAAVLKPGTGARFYFKCPACGCAHWFDTTWTFNGDMAKPTVQPSILTGGYVDDIEIKRCHSYVTDGRIAFCADSQHALAGQTVDLEPW